MDPTDRQDGHDRADLDPKQARADAADQARGRFDRRAESLRANLKRRKAQGRVRAGAERSTAAD